eukprot:4778717-Alexandrium_andersonii.AAC.1
MATPDLISCVKSCTIDREALFEVHRPVRVVLSIEHHSEPTRVLSSPTPIDAELHRVEKERPDHIGNCIDQCLQECESAMQMHCDAQDVHNMWNVRSCAVERGMLCAIGRPPCGSDDCRRGQVRFRT